MYFKIFQPYSEKMKNTTDEDKKNMYLRIIVSVPSRIESESEPNCIGINVLVIQNLTSKITWLDNFTDNTKHKQGAAILLTATHC